MYPKDEELINKPIVNYDQMRTMYTRTKVPTPNLYAPVSLIQAMNFLADHEDEHIMYAQMNKGERRAWLKNYLLNHWVAPIPIR